MDWNRFVDRAPKEAKAFYATIAAATATGVLLNFTPIDPIQPCTGAPSSMASSRFRSWRS